MAYYESTIVPTQRKRIRTSKYEEIDVALFAWFKEKRAVNIPLNGPILMGQACDFAALLNIEYKPTNGCSIQRFISEHERRVCKSR